MLQPQQAISAAAAATQAQDPPESGWESATEAPPKQVALAMERLGRAARVIADIRLGADRLLEALLLAADSPQQSTSKTIELIRKEETAMRQHSDDLRALGKQLEDSGVLSGSLKSRGNSWGLHMPLVCPDGAVVAYAWKRQLAGQAGASAVDRTRLALKAFTDQKRRFFPHLEDEVSSDGELGIAKKHFKAQGSVISQREEFREKKSLFDILKDLEHQFPNVRIFTYQRLDWSKRASLLSSANENLIDPLKDQINHASNTRSGSVNIAPADQTAVIELLVPSIFRSVVSLHPAGSINPDAVAFFATDEGGNYIHARGLSVHHVFRHVTEHADKALQYFLSVDNSLSLSLLLHWICSHETLFSKPCSKCGRLLTMDKSLALLLPPVHRAYWEASATNSTQTESTRSTKATHPDNIAAYHIGCSAKMS
ncbi:mediator of RNA polymerase II transcription subunit 27 isoform X2 [Canna indica]|uniref:Mediator of RNA polymerase II transcription subunit 27 isoform X2 n=1 Tax=Canna indica TaxID=4628 RepID=A0AAQ3JW82_9LILI|nr:mediator of RNA polymerase II transcription subunit 27 isoform X2 [Canna indica]